MANKMVLQILEFSSEVLQTLFQSMHGMSRTTRMRHRRGSKFQA